MDSTQIKLPGGGSLKLFPSSIVVYNFASDDDGKLSQTLSAHPGMPVLFLSTEFNRDVFSQAENHNRTFIFSRTAVDPATVDPVYPAQWVSEGDFIPALPGNLSVTATATGFRVDTLPPDTPHTATFGSR